MRKIENTYTIQSGGKSPMPVLFTCPHGGREKLEQTRERDICNLPTPPCSRKKFSTEKDRRTKELTEKIIQNIVNLNAREVYSQIANVHRAYVDLNRSPKCAFETSTNQLAEKTYNKYHNGILETIKKMYIQNDTGLCFLFDIHGTEQNNPDDGTSVDIFFGTDHHKTICGLMEVNPKALWDNTGLIKLLQDKGYHTYPQIMGQDEFDKLDGGTTIKKYGGRNVKQRVEAIQCEVHSYFRINKQRREQFARDFAECILTFVTPYISRI
jgi:N-formylglutamate amidohydrolase